MAVSQQPVVWVDDSHAVLRRGIVTCLKQSGFEVCGESEGLVPEPPVDNLDVLVLEATPQAVGYADQSCWPERLSVIATVRLPPTADVRLMALAGVRAFLDRDGVTPDALSKAVRGAAAGSVVVPVAAFGEIVRHGTAEVCPGRLAPRERDVLRLLAEGCDTRAIGGTLSYSERTVKNIVHDVMVKLDCRTRAQAVGVATRRGWI